MRIKYILYAMLGIGVTIILGGLFLLQKEMKQGEASLPVQNVSLSTPKQTEVKPMYRITRDARIVPIDTDMDTHIVLLTIDDGPSVHTNTIKDILKKRNIGALFFINGNRNILQPGIIQALNADGFEIGNHTQTHRNLKKETNQEIIKKEITMTTDIIEHETGSRPRFFRPPYGEFTPFVRSFVQSEKMIFMNWVISSKDWEHDAKEKDVFIGNIVNNLSPGATILIHEHLESSMYLDDLITSIQAKGYTIVDPRMIISFEEHPNYEGVPVSTTQTLTKKPKPSCPAPRKKYEDQSLLDIDKTVGLPDITYIPKELEYLTTTTTFTESTFCLTKDTRIMLEKMLSAAKKDGYTIRVTSAFRSYEYQETIRAYNIARGNKNVDMAVALPGHSEHQLGTTVDVTGKSINYQTTAQNFKSTPEYTWLTEHAYLYGFVESYPKDKETEAGYMYEPWHYRYIGIDHADTYTKGTDTLNIYLRNLKK